MEGGRVQDARTGGVESGSGDPHGDAPWLSLDLCLPALHVALHDGGANHHAVALEAQQLSLMAAMCAVKGSVQGGLGSICLRTTLREAHGALMQCPDPGERGAVSEVGVVCFVLFFG